jgi:DNA-binding transcriptional regulator YiaG
MTQVKVAPKLSKSVLEQYETLVTKSSRIRFLSSTGMSTSDIARYMNIRYQHVRNVLITPLKSA